MTQAAVPRLEHQMLHETTNTAKSYRAFRGELKGYLLKQTGNEADAEELVSAAFLRLQEQLSSADPLRDPRAWLYRVTKNLLIDHRRRRQRRPEQPLDSDLRAEQVAPEDETTDALEELASCVGPLLSHLGAPYREAVIATDLEGQSMRTAADAAQISVSGMKSRVQRGRSQLRDELLQCCEIELDRRRHPIDFDARSGQCPCGHPKPVGA